ncbi:hypothetical protein JB92DRAFT_2894780, partial [Gautieria morchelliformis]
MRTGTGTGPGACLFLCVSYLILTSGHHVGVTCFRRCSTTTGQAGASTQGGSAARAYRGRAPIRRTTSILISQGLGHLRLRTRTWTRTRMHNMERVPSPWRCCCRSVSRPRNGRGFSRRRRLVSLPPRAQMKLRHVPRSASLHRVLINNAARAVSVSAPPCPCLCSRGPDHGLRRPFRIWSVLPALSSPSLSSCLRTPNCLLSWFFVAHAPSRLALYAVSRLRLLLIRLRTCPRLACIINKKL